MLSPEEIRSVHDSKVTTVDLDCWLSTCIVHRCVGKASDNPSYMHTQLGSSWSRLLGSGGAMLLQHLASSAYNDTYTLYVCMYM